MFKTKEQVILEEYDCGLAPESIKEKYGFSFGTIYYFLNKNSRTLRGKSETFKIKAAERLRNYHAAGGNLGKNHWSAGKLKIRNVYTDEFDIVEELKYYIDRDITIKQMSELMGVNPKTITNWLKKFGLQQGMRSGNRHQNWKGGHSKYRGEDWYIQRQKALIRDSYLCQDCGIKKSELENPQFLHVHHIIPYEKSQDNSLENLITLCNKCHQIREHQINIF